MQGIGVIGLVLVWTGALSTLWNVVGNWNPAQVPPGGVAALHFPAGAATKVSRNNIDLSLSPPLEIQISADGYDIAGNPVPTCGIDASYPSGSSIVGFDVIGHATCAEVEFRAAAGGTLNIAGDLPAKNLAKTGAGTVHFQIADGSARTLDVRAGGAVVEASFAGTAVTLNGGTLAGSGTVASITGGSGSINPGGNSVLAGLRPVYRAAGDGAGTLHSGNISLDAATTLTIELVSAVSADRLAVTGSVSLGGAALAATAGFAPSTTASTTFTIVENDGADVVTGTFAGLAEGAVATIAGRSVRVSYVGGDGNDVTLTVLPVPVALDLSPASLTPMNVGQAANATIAATNGTGPCTFAITGGALPAGLALSAAGALSGTPTTAGSYSMTVEGTDALGNTGTRMYTGTIGSASASLTVAPATLPAMRVGVAFSQTITAAGGTAPYTFALTAGSLPAGLTLGASGALTGTPATAGAYAFTVAATDSGIIAGINGRTLASTASLAYSGTVLPADGSIAVSPATLPPFTVGEPASATLTASNGTGPYTFAVTGGALPAGLSLSTSGGLSGTPTAAGAYSVTVTATDATATSGGTTYAGTVAPAPVPTLPWWALAALAGVLFFVARSKVAVS